MRCPICDNEVEAFHKRSHLIPEWMYKECYSEKHKLIEIDPKKELARKKQKGIYDEIICTECEHQSQKYDQYASLIFTDRAIHSPEYRSISRTDYQYVEKGETRLYSIWKNIDFIKLQKFVFACVLRTHFSRQKRGDYLLIDKHFENILKLYKDEKILDDSSYPITIVKYLNNDSFKNIMHLPFRNKQSGHHIIDFGGAGFFFWVFASSHSKPDYAYNLSLKKDGSIHIIHEYIENCGTFKGCEPSIRKVASNNPIKP